MEIHELVARQRAYFDSGVTRSPAFRREALLRLRAAIRAQEGALCQALEADLGKPEQESYMTEIGLVLEEISYHLSHLRRWSAPRRVPAPLWQFPAGGRVLPEPLGVVLLMAPWNYPVQLCLLPLVGAISAGCCAVVKPSAYAPHASAAVAKLLGKLFPPEYVAVVEGSRAQNSALLEERFDHIFFTGSAAVGRVVMTAAARNLTPVTLELGGKSPVIVDETADVEVAARRILFGKVVNAGQTCVAPDYAYVHEAVLEPFLAAFRKALTEFFPRGDMSVMPRIINDKHFQRLAGLLDSGRIVIGGKTDAARRQIVPTVLLDVPADSPIMEEEIFGPLLPVLPYTELTEILREIQSRPRPLALYLFTRKRSRERFVFDACSFGGGCVNDTLYHVSAGNLPFGGVGASGMGSYHGKRSFDTFTHFRSVLRRGNHPDLRVRYRPYSEGKNWLTHLMLR